MKRNPSKKFKRILTLVLLVLLCYFIFNGFVIYKYSDEYSEKKSDVAIVLGGGTANGRMSPVFKERANHSIYLYHKKTIKKIILTGGFGTGQSRSDSEIAKDYLVAQGLPSEVIIVEKKSRYTIENLLEARQIMDSLGFRSALIVTDPLHMKRSITLAEALEMNCKPSPTKTTMYRSFWPKTESLVYETFYYSLGNLTGNYKGKTKKQESP
ncbi:YdcF family protein [Flavobacterium pedocola]